LGFFDLVACIFAALAEGVSDTMLKVITHENQSN
jgi:hypothetical protein